MPNLIMELRKISMCFYGLVLFYLLIKKASPSTVYWCKALAVDCGPDIPI